MVKKDQESGIRVCPQNAYVAFFNALQEEGVEPLVKAASDLYGRPILLTDENYRLLCQYPKKKMGQYIWDTLYETGTLPPDIVWEYQKMYLYDLPKIYEPFYGDWGLAEDAPRIFGEVYTDAQKILGHIAIFMMGEPLGEYDLEVAKIFTQALMIKMSQKIPQNKSNARCLYDLLSPDTSEQVKILAMSVLKKQLKGNFCLMVTPIGESAAQKAYASTAVSRLGISFRNTVSTIYNNCIVTLFGEMSRLHHTEKERKFLINVAEHLKQNYLGSGISDCFTDFSQVLSRYQQAYYTARLQNAATIFYVDVAPDPMFMFLVDASPIEAFIHPVLIEIYLYDKANNTQYYKTLEIYSLSMHDKDFTANQLCIHRNTLLYRLNRIYDLFELPYEDHETALHLLNSFQLINVQKKVSQNVFETLESK